jgi:hypothetical protein
MVLSEDVLEQYCASWALASLAALRALPPLQKPELWERLFRLWSNSQDVPIRYVAGHALASQQLLPREEPSWCASISRSEIESALSRYGKSGLWMDKPASLVVAWYSRVLDDREIAARARELLSNAYPPVSLTLRDLLAQIEKSSEEKA